MAKTNKTAAMEVRRLQRQAEVLALRLAGHSFPQIAELIKKKLSYVSASYNAMRAYEDLTKAVRPFVTTLRESAAYVVELELQRLDEMLHAALPKAKAGDVAAIDRVLKIMDRRADYIPGVNAPKQLRIDWDKLDEATLARLAAGEPPEHVLGGTE